MRINVQFDTRALKVRTEREIKRLAFNTAQALNETAKEIQTAERVNLDRRFTLRRATFMYRLVKIFHFASARKGKPFAEVGIDNKKRVLLSQFEKGGIKKPVKGGAVAVPITGEAARPRFAEPVPERFAFRRLRFRKRKTKSGPQFVGKEGTFILPGVGVFRRVERTISLLYGFVRRPRLDPILEFRKIAERTFRVEFPKQFRRAFRRE